MLGFSGGADSKEFACSEEDLGSAPGLGRSPGEGKGYPLQYSYLENLMDRGAWCTTTSALLVFNENKCKERKSCNPCSKIKAKQFSLKGNNLFSIKPDA